MSLSSHLNVGVRQVVLDDDDEAAVRAWVEQRRAFVKRLPDTGPGRPGGSAPGTDRRSESVAASGSAPAAAAAQTPAPKAAPAAGSSIGFGKAPLGPVVRKRKAEAPPAATAVPAKKLEEAAVEKQIPQAAAAGAQAANGDAGSGDEASAGGLAGLLGGYGSSGSGSEGSPS
jgi:hypothetical protein